MTSSEVLMEGRTDEDEGRTTKILNIVSLP